MRIKLLTLFPVLILTQFNILSSAQSFSYNTIANPSSNISTPFSYYTNISQALSSLRAVRNADSTVKNKIVNLPANYLSMTNTAFTTWLVNDERTVRGMLPLRGEIPLMNTLAQNYANQLASTNQFTHTLNGTNPWLRMDAVPSLKACREFNPRMESLYKFSSMGLAINDKLFIINSMVGFLYKDAGSAWGHREHILVNYLNNNKTSANEGNIGIGITNWKSGSWDNKILVIETMDPTSNCIL
jgi:hypothetical protein